ncbi:hypothetical protein PAPYR_11198 [Paratrimastix pyriformis]|uniref:Uncharacterized protein n=1 Tax=Paratrimastix pyriformis TaxID=342808 RepID=A0ABQ8U8H9_9EUKA|nr:hypothetical protein PAPYR_11198 [Paratrimastix pyriformis]
MTVPQLEAVKSAISKWEGTDWAVALVGKGPREQLVVMLAEVLDRAFTAADQAAPQLLRAALALQPVPQPVTATVPQPVPQPAQLAPVLAAPPIRGPQDPCIFVGVCEALAGILEAVLPDHPSQTPQTIRAVEGDLIWGPHRRFVWLSLGLPGPAGQERARGIGPETAD